MSKDVTQNVYFADPERFADLINGYVGHGEVLILPQNLQSMDPRSGLYKIVDFDGEPEAVHKRSGKK